jgi:hypothetical protein
MADDPGELDDVRDGFHWWVVGRSEKRHATKGEAIAEAWAMTPAGATRPDVKRSWDNARSGGKLARGGIVRRDDPRGDGVEVNITLEDTDERVVEIGEVAVTMLDMPKSAVFEITVPVVAGVDYAVTTARAKDRLRYEAEIRGLTLIGAVQLEMVFERDTRIRLSARAMLPLR